MLTIRLQRTGRKNAASFRIVVAEKTAHVSKKFHEVLGVYTPRKKEFNVKHPERVQYWIDQHVEMSPTVHNLFVNQGLLKADKVKAFNIPKKEAAPEASAPEAAPAAQTPEQTEQQPSSENTEASA